MVLRCKGWDINVQPGNKPRAVDRCCPFRVRHLSFYMMSASSAERKELPAGRYSKATRTWIIIVKPIQDSGIKKQLSHDHGPFCGITCRNYFDSLANYRAMAPLIGFEESLERDVFAGRLFLKKTRGFQ